MLSHALTYNQGSFSEILRNGCVIWETLNLVAECLFQLSWCWVSCPCLGCVTWLGSTGRKGGSAGGFLSCHEYWCMLLFLHFACCYSSVRNGALRPRQERWFLIMLSTLAISKEQGFSFPGEMLLSQNRSGGKETTESFLWLLFWFTAKSTMNEQPAWLDSVRFPPLLL